MAESPNTGAGPCWSIGDDDVHPMERQLGNELLDRLVCAADDLNGVAEPKCGFEEPPHERRGKDVGDADDQPQRSTARPSPERVDELAPQREDLVGVRKGDAAGLREHQLSSPAGEELFAEHLLEPMDLAADGGVRQAELLARSNDASFLRDDPEVEEMVIVEPWRCRSSARATERETRSAA